MHHVREHHYPHRSVEEAEGVAVRREEEDEGYAYRKARKRERDYRKQVVGAAKQRMSARLLDEPRVDEDEGRAHDG